MPHRNLSTEVLSEILLYLCNPDFYPKRRDLFFCLLVSRRWHDIARPLLWKCIDLDLEWEKYHTSRPDQFDARPYHDVIAQSRLNIIGAMPVDLEQLCECREPLKQRRPELATLTLCRYLSICADMDASQPTPGDGSSYESATLTTIPKLVSIVSACNNLHELRISLDVHLMESGSQIYHMFESIFRHVCTQRSLKMFEIVLNLGHASFSSMPTSMSIVFNSSLDPSIRRPFSHVNIVIFYTFERVVVLICRHDSNTMVSD